MVHLRNVSVDTLHKRDTYDDDDDDDDDDNDNNSNNNNINNNISYGRQKHHNIIPHNSAVEHDDLHSGNFTCCKHKDTCSGLPTNLLLQHQERHFS
jgi:hypothetical protein